MSHPDDHTHPDGPDADCPDDSDAVRAADEAEPDQDEPDYEDIEVTTLDAPHGGDVNVTTHDAEPAPADPDHG